MKRDADGGEPAADNGHTHQRASTRREFFRDGLKIASAGALGLSASVPVADAVESADARPPWMLTPGVPFTPYGQPSPHERLVTRSIGANRAVPGNGSSFTPLEDLAGIITPSGLHFERHHNGVPQIDPALHKLVVHGQVEHALSFSADDLLHYPQQVRQLFIECGGNSAAGWNTEPAQKSLGGLHGLVSCSEWVGVPLRLLLNEAGVRPDAPWLIAEGADAAAMQISLPMSKALDDCFIALYQNGERLRPEQGYPMRLIVPGWSGVLHVKWLRRLQVSSEPAMGRNETAKYTELMPDGRARQFAFVNEVKSVITSPSHGQTLEGAGWLEVRGLAWSGRGKISRVEVSVDGGQHWQEAGLHGPVQDKCFTRFQLPWRWDGRQAVIKSRATDETGAVQPERRHVIATRGQHADYRYNAIVAWSIDDTGTVTHVYA
jgi:sulfane dehydrogenase subunit SoxC